MPNAIEGQLVCPDTPIAIVVSRFNELITNRLVEGACQTITRHGGNVDSIDVSMFRDHLRFRSQHRNSLKVRSTPLSSVWVP